MRLSDKIATLHVDEMGLPGFNTQVLKADNDLHHLQNTTCLAHRRPCGFNVWKPPGQMSRLLMIHAEAAVRVLCLSPRMYQAHQALGHCDKIGHRPR